VSCNNVDVCATLISMTQQLAAIQQALNGDLELTTLIQRYRVPFAYIRGAVHSGLMNSGSFAITRLVGVRTEITAAGPNHRQVMGTPPYVRDLGWISVSDGNGMLQEIRLTRDRQVWFPQSMELATLLGFSVASDVTMEITELEAEP
jgi:hypothetical protein